MKFRNNRHNPRLGRHKESLAAGYLQKQGLTLFKTNYRCKLGEIDLVMIDETSKLVFVEVKYRNSAKFGSALESVVAGKILRIKRTAAVFLQQYPQFRNSVCRFDVVAIDGTGAGSSDSVRWIINAFC